MKTSHDKSHIIKPVKQRTTIHKDYSLLMKVEKHSGSRYPALIPSDVEDIHFSEFERNFYTHALKHSIYWTINRNKEPILELVRLEKEYWKFFQHEWWVRIALPRYIKAVKRLKYLWENDPHYQKDEAFIEEHIGEEDWFCNFKKHPVLICHDCHDELMATLDRLNHVYMVDHYDIWGCGNPPTQEVYQKLIISGVIQVESKQLKLF